MRPGRWPASTTPSPGSCTARPRRGSSLSPRRSGQRQANRGEPTVNSAARGSIPWPRSFIATVSPPLSHPDPVLCRPGGLLGLSALVPDGVRVEVLTAHGVRAQVRPELVDQRDVGGGLHPGDLVVRYGLEVLDQRPQSIAV